tara:strand:- start:545 stop:2455 length:1911 start_codon:yes stop_codon:yes gene_type:complete
MAKTQRVLSGSRTKGSTASPSGSIIYSYQGIYADTNASYFGSLLPRIGSGNRTKLYKGSKPLSENQFDDSLVINNDTADMRGVSGSIITTRIGFDLERMTFGQAPTIQKGEPFADISGFDPVSYIQDPGHTLWPANLWNIGSLPDHEFDGVIEVFDVRTEMLGQVDTRYEGHAPRGALVGSFSENPFGSYEISDSWKRSDHPISPFFDGPNEMSRDRARDIPVLARMTFTAASSSWADPNSVVPAPGYLGLVDETTYPVVDRDYHKLLYSKIYKGNPPSTFLEQKKYNLTSDFTTRLYPAFNVQENRYQSSANLIGWWPLDEPFGSLVAIDSATLAMTGAIGNTGVTCGYTTDNPAANFNNSLSYIYPSSFSFAGTSVGASVKIPGFNSGDGSSWDELVGGNFGTNSNTLKDISISIWVRGPATADNGIAMIIGDIRSPASTYGGSIYIWIKTDGSMQWVRKSGGNYYRITSAANTVLNGANGGWTHILCTGEFSKFDGSTHDAEALMKVYINGELINPASSDNEANTLSGDNASILVNEAKIGAAQNTASNFWWWAGGISNAAVWNKALSAEEVKAVFSAQFFEVSGGKTQDPMVSALEELNTDSCNALTNPLEERANHGFYFGKKAGSIVYGDW